MLSAARRSVVERTRGEQGQECVDLEGLLQLTDHEGQGPL
jgi:hypothetical protein